MRVGIVPVGPTRKETARAVVFRTSAGAVFPAMIAVVQRVIRASVRVGGEVVGAIDAGLLVLLGVAQGDTSADAEWLANKCAELRIFRDEADKMNLSVRDTEGSVLVVSQFTLLGDCSRGRRPSFTNAAPPAEADRLYQEFVGGLTARGLPVATGVFQAMMEVELINDGPVTLLLDSRSAAIR